MRSCKWPARLTYVSEGNSKALSLKASGVMAGALYPSPTVVLLKESCPEGKK